jgi:hypothetical protein
MIDELRSLLVQMGLYQVFFSCDLCIYIFFLSENNQIKVNSRTNVKMY